MLDSPPAIRTEFYQQIENQFKGLCKINDLINKYNLEQKDELLNIREFEKTSDFPSFNYYDESSKEFKFPFKRVARLKGNFLRKLTTEFTNHKSRVALNTIYNFPKVNDVPVTIALNCIVKKHNDITTGEVLTLYHTQSNKYYFKKENIKAIVKKQGVDIDIQDDSLILDCNYLYKNDKSCFEVSVDLSTKKAEVFFFFLLNKIDNKYSRLDGRVPYMTFTSSPLNSEDKAILAEDESEFAIFDDNGRVKRFTPIEIAEKEIIIQRAKEQDKIRVLGCPRKLLITVEKVND